MNRAAATRGILSSMARFLLILALVAQPLLWWPSGAASGAAGCEAASMAACGCCCQPSACVCCISPSESEPLPVPPATPPANAPELFLPSARLIAVLARPEADARHAGLPGRDDVPAEALVPAQARLCIWLT